MLGLRQLVSASPTVCVLLCVQVIISCLSKPALSVCGTTIAVCIVVSQAITS